VGLLEGTEGEYVGVVPAFAQCGVGEDEGERFRECDELVFLFEDQLDTTVDVFLGFGEGFTVLAEF
jgi:hypothetical protein